MRELAYFHAVLAACMLPLTTAAAAEQRQQTSEPPVPIVTADGPFEQTLELQGVRFKLSCPNESSINTLSIQPAALEVDNSSR